MQSRKPAGTRTSRWLNHWESVMRDDNESDLDTMAGILASVAIGAGVWALALLLVWMMP